MSAIGNYLKKLVFTIRNGKSPKETNQAATFLADDKLSDAPSVTDQARIVAPKKKPSRAHMSDFTIF